MDKILLGINKIIILFCMFLFLFVGCHEKKEDENKDSNRKILPERRLPDNLFTIETKLQNFHKRNRDLGAELTLSIHGEIQYYLQRFNVEQDCFDYQFLYYYDNSNYLLKTRSFDLGKTHKSCFIRWANNLESYKKFGQFDTIYSNIDAITIKEIFPEYRGKLIHEEITSIYIRKGCIDNYV